MLIKIDDNFPNSWKIFAAAEHLGPYSTGRILAVWLEMASRCVQENTQVFPLVMAATLRHDKRPMRVIEAMARPCSLMPGGAQEYGLLERVSGGYWMFDLKTEGSRRDGPSRPSMQPMLPRVIERWGARCVYCRVESEALQVDHIIPVCQGGGDELDNLAPACERCNKRKGGRTATEFGYPEVEMFAKVFSTVL
jgi:5-methylcytosine-specific restriction endonuclease McrA